MNKKYSSVFTVMLILFLLPSLSPAAIITFNFAATVNYLSDSDELLGGGVSLGDTFYGQYSFDSLTPNSSTSPDIQGQFHYFNSPYGITGNVGSVSFDVIPDPNRSPPTYSIYVNNDLGTLDPDRYFIRSEQNGMDVFGLGVDRVIFDLDLGSSDSSMFLNTDLLLEPPDLSQFDVISRVRLAGGGSNYFDIRAELTSLTLASVPEPSTLALLGLGLLGLGLSMRERPHFVRIIS